MSASETPHSAPRRRWRRYRFSWVTPWTLGDGRWWRGYEVVIPGWDGDHPQLHIWEGPNVH